MLVIGFVSNNEGNDILEIFWRFARDIWNFSLNTLIIFFHDKISSKKCCRIKKKIKLKQR